ncbi:MAG: transposase [Candidatus Omnitrophota bacterium]|nr:MAG: transposase [Candidatus Omnitrophota bacterium]
MNYYSVLGLEKEPFSTSPDPEFFYYSHTHKTAIERLEIAIRLKRGLSLLLGDVGTGKTTLLRTFLQSFPQEEEFIFYILLDPGFNSEFDFLSKLTRIFNITPPTKSILDYKECIERYLFQKSVEEKKTIVLFIDEGQKLTPKNLEALRVLLNYETNEYKLLQIVITAQLEILSRLKQMKNFMDRISLKYVINPLSRYETKRMIEYRLQKAGFSSQNSLFTEEAIELIYEYTQGYPRQITLLCHNALERLVMKEKKVADRALIEEVIEEEVI